MRLSKSASNAEARRELDLSSAKASIAAPPTAVLAALTELSPGFKGVVGLALELLPAAPPAEKNEVEGTALVLLAIAKLAARDGGIGRGPPPIPPILDRDDVTAAPPPPVNQEEASVPPPLVVVVVVVGFVGVIRFPPVAVVAAVVVIPGTPYKIFKYAKSAALILPLPLAAEPVAVAAAEEEEDGG